MRLFIPTTAAISLAWTTLLAAKPPEPAKDDGADTLPAGAVARLGTPSLRHQGKHINVMTFSPDGKLLASLGEDEVLRIWDLATGREVQQIRDDRLTMVRALEFTPDSKAVLSHNHRVIRFWDVKTGKETRRIEGEPGMGVSHFVITRDFKTLAFNVGTGGVVLVDLASGEHVRRLGSKPPKSAFEKGGPDPAPSLPVAFSPDGLWLLGYQGDVFDTKTARRISVRSGPPDEGGTPEGFLIGFSADGKAMLTLINAATKDDEAFGENFTALRFLTVPDRKEARVIRFPKDERFAAAGLAPDGKTLALWSKKGGIQLLDLASGKWLQHIKTSGEPISRMVLSADGKFLAGATRSEIMVWNLEKGQLQFDFQKTAIEPLHSVLVLPDGKTAVAMHEQSISVFSVGAGKLERTIRAPEPISSLACDGKLVAAGCGGSVRIWTLETGKPLRHWDCESRRYVQGLAFSSDGKQLATTHSEAVRVWDAATGRLLNQVKLKEWDKCVDVVSSASGSVFAVGGGEGGGFLFAGPKHARLGPFGEYVRNSLFGPGMALASDGNALASVQPFFGESAIDVIMLDVVDQWLRYDKKPRLKGTTVTFASDGWSLVLGRRDGSIVLWDPVSGEEKGTFATDAGRVRSLAVIPGSQRVLSLHESGIAYVWDFSEALARRPAVETTPEQREQSWQDLANRNDLNLYRKMALLAADPKQTIPFLADKIRAVAAASPRSIPTLLADLEDRDADKHGKAAKELRQLGELALLALRGFDPKDAAAKASATRILEDVIAAQKEGNPAADVDLVRASRALIILSRIASPQARAALQTTTRLRPGTWLSDAASAAAR